MPTSTCPQCGSLLPRDAPKGLCAECLLKQGLSSRADSAAWPHDGDPTQSVGFTPPLPAELAPKFTHLQLEVLELLGQGGMGAVYRARQKLLDRTVALKVLPPDTGNDPAFAERFMREARAMAKLTHPNIVWVFDFGVVDGLYYLIMEFVDGVNLRTAIHAHQVSAQQALAIVPQICDALQYAHEEGVVHRDIKPENVLLDKKGRVKIADFGLAKLLGRSPVDITLTASHQIMGTLHYMAPEQIERPLQVDHRADIYSLGVVFYELLTGQLPLGRFALPSEKAHLDVRLDDVVLKTLQREPAERYQHASEVKNDVETISRSELRVPPPAARDEPRPNRPLRLPFSIPDLYAGFARAHGMARFDGKEVNIEFEVRDEIAGVIRSDVKDAAVGVQDILSIQLKRGWWKHQVLIQTDYLKVGEIPNMERGQIRLHIARGDLEIAERFVAAVDRAIREPAAPAKRPRHRVFEMVRHLTSIPPSALAGDDAAVAVVRSRLMIPAIALSVAGGLNLIAMLIAVWAAIGLATTGDDTASVALALIAYSALGTCSLILAPRIVSLRSYPLSVISAVLAAVHVSPIWFLGLPFAIWTLILLLKPESKRAFDRVARGDARPRPTLIEELIARVRGGDVAEPAIPGEPEYVWREVVPPATALILVGGLLLVPLILVPLAVVLAISVDDDFFAVLPLAIFLVPLGGTLLYGGLMMRRLQSYRWAVFASIAAICTVLGLPIGVWGLVALADPSVKSAFGVGTAGSRGRAEQKPKLATYGPVSPADLEGVRRRVRGPALGLSLVGLVNLSPLVMFVVAMVGSALLNPRLSPMSLPLAAVIGQASPPIVRDQFSIWIGLLMTCLICIPSAGLMLLAGSKMRRLELWGLSVLGSTVALIPCHVGFLIGFPVGIWSLMVLLSPEVRRAFASPNPRRVWEDDAFVETQDEEPAAVSRPGCLWGGLALFGGVGAAAVLVGAFFHFRELGRQPSTAVWPVPQEFTVEWDNPADADRARRLGKWARGRLQWPPEASIPGDVRATDHGLQVSVPHNLIDRVDRRLLSRGTLELRWLAVRDADSQGTAEAEPGGPTTDDSDSTSNEPRWVLADPRANDRDRPLVTRHREDGKLEMLVLGDMSIDQTHIASVDYVSHGPLGPALVRLQLTPDGAERWNALRLAPAAQTSGRCLGLILEGRVVELQEAPTLGSLVVPEIRATHALNRDELQDWAAILNSGPPPGRLSAVKN